MKNYRELVMSLIGLIMAVITLATRFNELNNSQLLRTVIILAYVIFAGGIAWFAFKNVNVNQNQRLLSLTFLCLLTIPFFFWVGSWTKKDSFDPCKEYGITITEPSNEYILVNGQVTIRGSFTKRPPDKSIQLIGLAGGQYWPHIIDNVEVTKTSWRGKSFGDGDYTALVAYVGENGRILFDYFQKAGELDNIYPGIDVLPADVFECDSVYIPRP